MNYNSAEKKTPIFLWEGQKKGKRKKNRKHDSKPNGKSLATYKSAKYVLLLYSVATCQIALHCILDRFDKRKCKETLL